MARSQAREARVVPVQWGSDRAHAPLEGAFGWPGDWMEQATVLNS